MKIWTDTESFEVSTNEKGEFIISDFAKALMFKAEHMKAKADPDIFRYSAALIDMYVDSLEEDDDEEEEEEEDSESDSVNHPSHYNTGSIETIDYIESLGFGNDFCRGNAIKYLSRAGKKGDTVEDLKKAIWYIQREIKELEEKSK